MSFYRFLLIHAAATRGATRPGGPAPSARRVTAPPPSGESRSRDATVPNSSADSKSRITLEFSFAPRASPIFLREDFSRTRERDSATRAPPDGRRWRKAGLETPRNSLLHSTRNSRETANRASRRAGVAPKTPGRERLRQLAVTQSGSGRRAEVPATKSPTARLIRGSLRHTQQYALPVLDPYSRSDVAG